MPRKKSSGAPRGAPEGNRNRAILTLATEARIARMYASGKYTHAELVEWLWAEHGQVVSQPTVSRICKKYEPKKKKAK